MKKVFFSFFKDSLDVDGYYIDSINYDTFLEDSRGSIRDLLYGGMNTWRTRRSLRSSEELHRLYREKHPEYMRYIEEFLDKYIDFDIIIMTSTVDLVHPEILDKYFRNKIKILAFIDDPHASYSCGTPYLWAFDGAYYISPSYNESLSMPDMLKKWGVRNSHWLPLSFTAKECLNNRYNSSFFEERKNSIVYIGGYYGSKVDRLIKLKEHFKDEFQIYGRVQVGGYAFAARGLLGKPFLAQKIKAVSDVEREEIYLSTKIGFNMHLNESPEETGNARMYEIPSYGMMQVTSKAGNDLHEGVFVGEKETVYYENLGDAIDKLEYYLGHSNERIEIAKAGYERVRKDYVWNENVKCMLDWAVRIKE